MNSYWPRLEAIRRTSFKVLTLSAHSAPAKITHFFPLKMGANPNCDCAGSNTASRSKWPVGICRSACENWEDKTPETVDAVGVQPTASTVWFFWRSGRDSNPRAVSAATRFPIVLVMTSSIPLQIGGEVTMLLAAVVRRNVDYYTSFSPVVKWILLNSPFSFFAPPAIPAADRALPATEAAARADLPPPADR